MNKITWIGTDDEPSCLGAVSGSISSMKKTMESFFQEIEEEIEAEPGNLKLIGARWAYRMAMDQFNNRFKKYDR